MAELKTFLFTDICGSVRLKGEMTGRSVTERDQAFIEQILSPHRAQIERGLAELGGRVVSTAGDGHFLVFDNTVQAAQWAIGVQESHRDDPIKTPKGDAVEVRISIHVGVPQTDPGDPNNFVGKTVDYAARLNDHATGEQILVSRSVMAILDDVGLEGIRLHSHGKKGLKGIGNVEIYELLYDKKGPRSLRNAPKSEQQRQWTVLPTVGYERPGQGSVAVAPALKRVGNYELEELLGSGGMGDVYKGRHVQFGRIRAVKVIKPQFVTGEHGEMIRRFYNEIKAVGRLEHKNIVVAIDSSSPGDKIHYLVMEYIDGAGVDDLVARNGQVPVAEACEIIRQAARGLQFIHKNDMVHRDLKPSNLMVTVVDAEAAPDSTLTQQSDGERAVVKILDLGLALLAEDGQDRLTRYDHQAMGTGMYMSPEQWKTTSVDIRADIYSLGCTLYHLLSGNPPFADSDLRPEKAHEKSAVPPIRSGQPIPKKLWDVIRKMLEKRPEDRYATPAEVSAALAPFCEGQQLAKLVRSYQFDAAPSKVHHTSATLANGAAQVDTWRSKSKGSVGGALSSLQPWSGVGLRTLILAALAGAVLWMFSNYKQQYVARETEKARNSLAGFARTAAKDKGNLAQDIAKRFQILIEAASNPELIRDLAAHNKDRGNAELRKSLDDWIGKFSHGIELDKDSVFILDVEGEQIARSPRNPDNDTVGQNFKRRDYFHGQGREFDESHPEDRKLIAEATPIQRPHLSAVYKSSSSNLLKVAFSTPIWETLPRLKDEAEFTVEPVPAGEPGEPGVDPDGAKVPNESKRRVIGVLAMTVNVADFEVLEADQQGGNDVVLVDMRRDFEQKKGLILNHPQQRPTSKPQRIDEELAAAIEKSNPLGDDFSSEASFQQGYTDPFDSSQPYWGAFQPVAITLPGSPPSAPDGGPADRPLWVVIVQERMP